MHKLVIVTDSFLPRWDGIARFIIEVLPFVQQHFDVHIIAPDFEGAQPQLNVPVHRIALSSLSVGDYVFAKWQPKRLKHLLADAHIVWTQTMGPLGMSAQYIARRQKKVVIHYMHSVDWDLVSKSIVDLHILRSLLYMCAKMFIIPSLRRVHHLMLPSLEVEELLKKKNVHIPLSVIPLGVDTQKFCPSTQKDELKKALGYQPQDVVIGFVGRLAREKDLKTLLRAFVRVRKTHPQAKLLVVGDGLASIKSMLAQQRGVLLVGSQQDVVSYYQAMDIYVLSSLLETTSLTTLEAMACGVAPLITPVGFAKDHITEKQNGMLFPIGNSLVLALKLTQLIQQPALRHSIGQQARNSIIQQRTWQHTAQQCVDILQKYI
ncbi:MAG: glycosyltransferase family 4 protein [Candidatus Woesearchaeota archaeon]